FARALPRELREPARGLPFRIGLTARAGDGFEEFVRLEPNRELPCFAVEDPRVPGRLLVDGERLDRARAAHHLAAAFGLIADRLADEQVTRDPLLVAIRDATRDAW